MLGNKRPWVPPDVAVNITQRMVGKVLAMEWSLDARNRAQEEVLVWYCYVFNVPRTIAHLLHREREKAESWALREAVASSQTPGPAKSVYFYCYPLLMASDTESSFPVG